MPAIMPHQLVRFLSDGRVVMRTENGHEYVAILGSVPANGNNLVFLPDRSAEDIPVLDQNEADNANEQARLDQEALRERRLKEARGVPPDVAKERGVGANEPPPNTPAQGIAGDPQTAAALAEVDAADAALAEQNAAAEATKAKAGTKAKA